MIFGSWAILSSYFDLISSDREHNVLDCIMCAGIPKFDIFISKVLVTMIMSLVLSFIYLLPVTCVIIGLLLMPRFFVMLVESVGKVFGWTEKIISNVSLIAPGVMMQALSEVSDTSKFLLSAVIFTISIIVFFVFAYLTFVRQDEYNYGE